MKNRILWITVSTFLFVMMITNSEAVFHASMQGINTWAKVLVPALLPFMIVANLLMRLGIINLLGVLLEPIMRPLFNVSGTGGFVMAIGFTSGFPISSLLTAELRQENKLTRDEAARLMSFTNNASPLFMFSAISVGMFNYPQLGLVLAAGHYCSNLLLGLAMGFFSKKTKRPQCSQNILKKAYQSLQHTPSAPFGLILGESINKAIKNMLSIGGFVVFFAIALAAMDAIGVLNLVQNCLGLLIALLGLNQGFAAPICTGLFEVTLGIKQVADTQGQFYQQVAIASAILAWNGLSIHAQVASFISKTDIKYWTFFWSRVAQAGLAPVITLFFLHQSKATFAYLDQSKVGLLLTSEKISPLMISGLSLANLLALLSLLVLISLVWWILKASLNYLSSKC